MHYNWSVILTLSFPKMKSVSSAYKIQFIQNEFNSFCVILILTRQISLFNWRHNHLFLNWLNFILFYFFFERLFIEENQLFICLKVVESFSLENKYFVYVKMINISCFFCLAKIFGLAPFALNAHTESKNGRIGSFIHRIPTFMMIFLYAIFVCSIFWKKRTMSEISNTANWIQVTHFPLKY